MRLVREETCAVLAADVRSAASPLARMRGLMGRAAMPGDGLLIAPADSIHTCFMRMAIDVVFLGAGGTILKLCPGVRPWRIRLAPRGARAVLELPAGFIARHGLRNGELLRMEG